VYGISSEQIAINEDQSPYWWFPVVAFLLIIVAPPFHVIGHHSAVVAERTSFVHNYSPIHQHTSRYYGQRYFDSV
jgi:hypothetical protein